MTLLQRRLAPSIAIALAASFYGCGGDKLTLPGNAQPTKIEVVTGNAQAGIVGTALPLPLVVKVTDELGRPVAGQGVGFTVTTGGGQAAPASVETDADGRASATWTLGPNAGDQAVLAQAVGNGAPDNLTQSFTATAVAGSGSLVAAVSGDDQSAPVNSALAEPLIVRVSDGNGNPVSGITIQWTVQNGGSIAPETVVTGDDGLATASRVLGPTAGQQTAQASGEALAGSPVTFVQTAIPSNPTTLTEVSGNAQTAPAGFEVAEDLVVKLTDDNGNGIGGLAVAWVVATGGGTVTPVNSTTDPTGLARTRWTLGGSAGANTLNAVFSGLPAVPFTATASSDVPANLAIASGDNQSAVGGAALANPLAVKVTDANNNGVANVSVAWTANVGGSVSAGTSATDAQGVARITRTLGATPGLYTTTAEVTGLIGSPITFNSTATAGPAAKIVIVTPPGTPAANGAQFSPQPVVQVQDAAGNNVGPAGRAITASLLSPPGGSSLHGDLGKDTDPTGLATFTDLNITGPVGVYTIRFRSGALTEARADVSVTAGPVSGAQSTVTATPASVAVGVATNITVTVRDAGGNPIPGATVALSATGGGNSFGPISGPTDANGQATATYSSTAVGSHTINAAINGTTTVTTPVAVTAGAPASIAISAGDGQTAQVGSPVNPDPAVIVRDASNNPVPGVGVTFAVGLGGGSVSGATATTNGSGIATVGSWTLGPTAGSNNNTLTATIDGSAIAPVTFTASANAGGASATQSLVSANPPAITAGGAGSTVTITAKDNGGNPIPGATVVLSDNAGGGFTAPAPTDANGVTTSTFTSNAAGDHTISATINGVAINATAVVTVQAGAAATVTYTQGPSSTTTGVAIAPAVVVHVADAFGNPATGTVLLTLTPIAGAGTLSGTNPQTLVNGDATFGDLSVDQTGAYSLTATSGSASSPDPQPSFTVGP